MVPVVTFDPTTLQFAFFEDSNLSLAGTEFKDYRIRLFGKVGDEVAIKE